MPRTKAVASTSIESIVSDGLSKIQHDITVAVNGLMFNAFKESMNGEAKTVRRGRRKTRRSNGTA